VTTRRVLWNFCLGRNEFNLASGGEAHYVRGNFVSGDYFRVLGEPPILGRVSPPRMIGAAAARPAR